MRFTMELRCEAYRTPRQNANCIFSRDLWNGWLTLPWLMLVNTLTDKTTKIAQYGPTIVVMHVLVHGLHGLAHKELPRFPLLQALFVGVVVILAPHYCSRFTLNAVLPHR
jgi:hypothetical protein